MPKISVIVPVYKAENTLQRCVDSILAQTFTDFELLLIDDGSPDRSGAICDDYAEKDPRVKVFHKSNGGVSSARNLGLDNAKGEWITFCDSDDSLNLFCLEKFMEFSNRDLVVADFDMPTGNPWNETITEGDYTGEELGLFLTKNMPFARMAAPWVKLFKRKIIGSLRFNTDLSSCEDTIFVMYYCLHIQSVYVSNDKLYNYYWCGNSLSRDLDLNHRQLPMFIEQMESACSALSQSYGFYKNEFTRQMLTGALIKENSWLCERRPRYKEIYRLFLAMKSSTAVNYYFSDNNKDGFGVRRRIFNRLFRMRSITPVTLYTYIIEHFTNKIY